MSSLSTAQQAEIKQLKSIAEQARAGTKRARFPQEFWDRVCALRKAGVSRNRICAELRLAASLLYRRETKPEPPTTPAPRVLAVETLEAPSAAAPLTLSCGAFIITVRVA